MHLPLYVSAERDGSIPLFRENSENPATRICTTSYDLNCGLPEYPHEHSFYTKFCGTFLTQACIYLSVCLLEDMRTSNHLENLVQQETEGSSQDCDAHFDPASLATRIGTTKHSSA